MQESHEATTVLNNTDVSETSEQSVQSEPSNGGSTVPSTANIPETPGQSGPSNGGSTVPNTANILNSQHNQDQVVVLKRELDKLNDELSLRFQPKTEKRKKLDYEVLLKTIKLNCLNSNMKNNFPSLLTN